MNVPSDDAVRRPVLGFDDRGTVFETARIVHRSIHEPYKAQVAALYRLYEEKRLFEKGVVSTALRADGNLEHEKLVVSYPYEWPASMFKDAVLFHLRLFQELSKSGLTLKDALPNNILFEGTRPIFVDFLSLVFAKNLGAEAWLGATGYADPRFAVADRMLFPYLVLPLLFFSRSEPAVARELLSTRSCNTDGRAPSWRELLRPPRRGRRALQRYLATLGAALKLQPARRAARRKDASGFDAMLESLIESVEALDVTPPRSGYSSYYDEKKEALSLQDHAAFLPKQKAVFDILQQRRPASVLDIGANTGWYSSLAAELGASVIALEEDESCVDLLFGSAKTLGRRILPLKVSFAELTREIYGAAALATDYPGRGVKENPLYRAGVERLDADLVLVLGLVHHLVLGEGRSLGEVFEVLSQLARKTLVLEFVSLEDDKVREEPGFFRNLRNTDPATYNLEEAMLTGRRYFSSVEVRASHPETRTILVFDK